MILILKLFLTLIGLSVQVMISTFLSMLILHLTLKNPPNKAQYNFAIGITRIVSIIAYLLWALVLISLTRAYIENGSHPGLMYSLSVCCLILFHLGATRTARATWKERPNLNSELLTTPQKHTSRVKFIAQFYSLRASGFALLFFILFAVFPSISLSPAEFIDSLIEWRLD